MSTRYYIRNQAPLEIRGISRSSLDMHPLMEGVPHNDGHPQIPVAYVRTVKQAMEHYQPDMDSRSSSRRQIPITSPRLESDFGDDNLEDLDAIVADDSVSITAGNTCDVDLSPSTCSAVSDWLVGGHSAGAGWPDSDQEIARTGGNTTDRTSLSSSDWGDDICEFDRQESRRVRQMFEEIESLLFDDISRTCSSSVTFPSSKEPVASHTTVSGPQLPGQAQGQSPGPHVHKECQEWVEMFPHFRLLGSQLVAPQDSGFSFHPSTTSLGRESEPSQHQPTPPSHPRPHNDTSPRAIRQARRAGNKTPTATSGSPGVSPPWSNTGSPRSSTGDVDCISIFGRRVEPQSMAASPVNSRLAASSESRTQPTNDNDSTSCSLEEEVFVQDGQYEEFIAIDYAQTDEDAGERKQISRHHRGYPPLTPNAVLRDSIANSIFDIQWAEIVASTRPLLCEILHRAYEDASKSVNTLSPNLSRPVSGIEYNGLRDSSIVRMSRASTPVPEDMTALSDLLQISTKTLQSRERPPLHDIAETVATHPRAQSSAPRPSSSLPLRVANSSRTASAGRYRTSTETRTTSARRGKSGFSLVGRLAPLDRLAKSPDADRYALVGLVAESGSSGVPIATLQSALSGSSLGLLRGRSLHGPAHPSPPAPVDLLSTRSGTLPPLNSSGHYTLLASNARPSGRVSSAAANQRLSSGLAHPLSQSTPLDYTNRPATTQSFRSDNLFRRRSSTPLGLRSGVLLNLNIHGNSIGPPAPAPGQILASQMDEVDGRARPPNWGIYPRPPSANNPYRRGRQNSFIR